MQIESLKSTSFVGLGEMGSAMVRALLRNGVSTTVWNRSSEKADPLVAQGANLASSLEECIQASPVTLICVSNHDATRELFFDSKIAEAGAGKKLIQISSVTSAEMMEFAAWAKASSAELLCGQITSYTDEVDEGTANIVCSGPLSLFENCKDILKAAAGNAYHVGESHGAAATFDKAHLSFNLKLRK